MEAVEGKLAERPDCCEYDCLATVYRQFEQLFLAEGNDLVSSCGHSVMLFDHHFFHLAAVRTIENSRLFMVDEKQTIKATTEGFGKYILDHGGSRARNLPSAKATMKDPDQVWEDNPRATTAKWVYIKCFDSLPYPFTVALLTTRPDEAGIIVPVSSFPCRKKDIKKWRHGKLIYQKQIQPPNNEGG